MRKYDTTAFNSYRLGVVKNRGTLTEGRTAIYTNGLCSIWSSSSSYGESKQAVQTNANSYDMNVSSEYSNIQIGDIIIINSVNYKVNNIIPHGKSNGIVDNYEIKLNITENAS